MSITAEAIELRAPQAEYTFARAWCQTVGSQNRLRTTGIPEASDARGYSRRIGAFHLLSRDEEVSLAKAIEVGLLADEKLLVCPDPTSPLVAELLLLAVRGDVAYQKLIQSNLKLVVCVAKRFSEHDAPLMDLILDGNEGLVQAVESFDFRRGDRFATHAATWIEQLIELGLIERLSAA